MAVAILLVGVIGGRTPHDGRYLYAYDPEWIEDPADGQPHVKVLETTADLHAAKPFAMIREAAEEWKRISPNKPVRALDGKPNRPLTAYTIEFVKIPSSGKPKAPAIERKPSPYKGCAFRFVGPGSPNPTGRDEISTLNSPEIAGSYNITKIRAAFVADPSRFRGTVTPMEPALVAWIRTNRDPDQARVDSYTDEEAEHRFATAVAYDRKDPATGADVVEIVDGTHYILARAARGLDSFRCLTVPPEIRGEFLFHTEVETAPGVWYRLTPDEFLSYTWGTHTDTLGHVI